MNDDRADRNAVGATFREDVLAGKVALVIGGTSGIGAAIARALATAGARVTATGATDEEVARATRIDAGHEIVAVDVREASAIDALIDRLPRLDILVNCAGIIRRGDEHRLDVFEDVLSVNLTGTMRCASLARPKLAAAAAKGGGAIVNTASVLSYAGGALVPA